MTHLRSLLVFSIGLLCTIHSMAQVTVARIFSDNMVLQRDVQVPVWGKAGPNEKIKVEINGCSIETLADKKGDWQVYLPSFEAGGPYELKINSTLVLKNVLFGDVWFASGQSNMEWRLENSKNGPQEVPKASFKNIRLFTVPKRTASSPKSDLEQGQWEVCTPETAKGFSAIAYYFGKDIHEKYNVPVGLINCTWGGTVAEAWTSTEMLKKLPDFTDRIIQLENAKENWENDIIPNAERDRKRVRILEESYNGLEEGFEKVSYSTNDWRAIDLPAYSEELFGVIWLRKVVTVPKEFKGQDLKLSLGRINHQSDVYFNGTSLGKTFYPEFVTLEVPGNLVKSGENVVTIRMSNRWGEPGFEGPESEMKLVAATGSVLEDMSGIWKFHRGLEPAVPEVKEYNKYPGSLFNGMVNPVIPYAIKGVIWYQGESNDVRAYQYRSLFHALIVDWEIRWEMGYLPFLYVQLPNYLDPQPEPQENAWAELREAQLMALDLPSTGMVVTIDLGEAQNLHPTNKKDVANRLTLCAQKVAYGEDVVHSGPLYSSMEINGNEIEISFEHIDGGLMAKGDKLEGFAIAGKDKKFYWADAQIVGGKVFVKSDKVKEPVAVRYAWASNPVCNLYNKKGLPASPFRTDDWDGITKGVK